MGAAPVAMGAVTPVDSTAADSTAAGSTAAEGSTAGASDRCCRLSGQRLFELAGWGLFGRRPNYAGQMEWILVAVIAAGGVSFLVSRRRASEQKQQTSDFELRAVGKVADEDVTASARSSSACTRDPHRRPRRDDAPGLPAGARLLRDREALMREPAGRGRHGVTKALEDGRYAVACVLARRER